MIFVQKVVSLTQILDFSYISHFCSGLTCTEIKTKIKINFSGFMKSGSVLQQ